MIQQTALYDLGIMVAYAALAIALKLLVAVYPARDAIGWRLLIGGAELFLSSCVGVLVLVYIALLSPESFGLTPAIVSSLIGTCVGIFVYGLNLWSEKKHRLSEKQKAELMDL